MKLIWKIDFDDIRRVQAFYNENKDSTFVLKRINKNIKKVKFKLSNGIFWNSMVNCLLTTQQRSGPNSPITKFMCINPYPLNYNVCKKATNLKSFAKSSLTKHGGIRRTKTIGEEIENNLDWLENNGWNKIKKMVKKLESKNTIESEKYSANLIMENLTGFGPKQSRNLLQDLGLTRYEVPIDSRITKWLNKFGFPLKLSAAALADIHYYEFVEDGFQRLCKACNIYPCVMDAAIFSSFDEDWPEDML